jgi:PAS domain S-box-containing protein
MPDFWMNTSTSAEFNQRRSAECSPPRDNDCMFQFLFERTSDAVCLIDPGTGTVVDCNDATAVLMRCTSRADLVGRRLEEFAASGQKEGSPTAEAVRCIAERFQSRNNKFHWKARRFDGTEVTLEGSATAIERAGGTVVVLVARDAGEGKEAEGSLLKRAIELVQANDRLKRAEKELCRRSGQMQKYRDALLELAHSNKSDLERALRRICSLSATTLDVARVSYWSVQEDDSAIRCEIMYLRDTESVDQEIKGRRLIFAEHRAYFDELAANRTIVARNVLLHPGASSLAENYLKPLGISSLLDAPVWECGEGVGVLRHEHVGPPRDWSPEEIDFVSALASIVSLALEESNRAQAEHLLRESEARLRESEARFGTAFRASPALMTISRLSDEKYIEVNDAFVRWYGLNRDNIIGHDTKELGTWLNPEDRANFWAELRRQGSMRARSNLSPRS